MPFALLTATVLVWGLPAVKRRMDAAASWKWPMPGLHNRIARGEAVTGHAEPDPKDLREGRGRHRPAVLDRHGGLRRGGASRPPARGGPGRMARMLGATVARLAPAIVAIAAMLALGFVTKASGMDVVLGLAFTRTGPLLYPVFGTLLGWLGVALTGSDTSSNVLFGNLQRVTAEKLGLPPILMASANTTGGVMGKMIDAQSIVVAAAATGEAGQEGKILRAVVGHSLALALIVGAIVWTYAHLLPGWVAQGPIVGP